jgi:hypothetical protein
MMQALREALSKIKGRLFWAQWIGNFLLMLLAAGWLQIPDSHSWQFLFSVLSGVLLVAAFVWLYTATFRYLLPCAPRPQWWLSCVFLAISVALWWLLLQPIDAARAHEGLFAGYWNSQSPHWLRPHLGYSSLVAWQERIYDCSQWVLAGLLVPPAMETAACGNRPGWMLRAARPYRHWLYWLCVLICGWAATTITWILAGWAPDAGLLGQTFSVIARLGVAYTADILLWCFLLSLIAHYEKDEKGGPNTALHTPVLMNKPGKV